METWMMQGVCTRRWVRGRALTLAAVLGVAAVVAVADAPEAPAAAAHR